MLLTRRQILAAGVATAGTIAFLPIARAATVNWRELVIARGRVPITTYHVA